MIEEVQLPTKPGEAPLGSAAVLAATCEAAWVRTLARGDEHAEGAVESAAVEAAVEAAVGPAWGLSRPQRPPDARSGGRQGSRCMR